MRSQRVESGLICLDWIRFQSRCEHTSCLPYSVRIFKLNVICILSDNWQYPDCAVRIAVEEAEIGADLTRINGVSYSNFWRNFHALFSITILPT